MQYTHLYLHVLRTRPCLHIRTRTTRNEYKAASKWTQLHYISLVIKSPSRLPVQMKLYPRTTQISTKITVKGRT